MRIIYKVVMVIAALVLWFAVQQWRGPELAALTVELKPLELRIVASGEVRYQSLARIGSEVTGTVIARHVREGDWVHQGDLLIELNPTEAQSRLDQAQTLLQQLETITRPQAQAALAEATENARQARREAQRRQTLVNQGTLSVEQAEQAQRQQHSTQVLLTQAKLTAGSVSEQGSEARLLAQRIASAQAELAKTRIYAPFTGRVQSRNVEPGDVVQANDVLLEIARSTQQTQQDELEVVVALDEKNLSPLQLEQPVQLIADAWPEQEISGVVSFIAPAVDSGRGTIDVHIRLLHDNAQTRALLPGMTVSANIIANKRAATLVLPNDYLQFNNSGQAQVMRWQQGKVQSVAVQLGLRNMSHSEVISGLEQGDIVVQNQALDDGQRARVRIEQAPHVIR
ncbi:efflux RND transporter periplasmic adaptor subunit [Oceanisphaera pacifica]|uniref:Efflux RND transporter periplasmic adaptor subunit n=1 Tax=Oceanisphaera pacifica TaxID=2818389 RepID=A0ABS3NCI1_9GAMM|nr:efflux RND transporter periplasmic adaptor subunit [Oceanisphaera pacifica]MBO1518308.1 efflux RND transporter periplasmic adaptor subunit [Oceanisphaera pacifica]